LLGRIFLTQQVQAAGAASEEDNATREPVCSREVAERAGFLVVFFPKVH